MIIKKINPTFYSCFLSQNLIKYLLKEKGDGEVEEEKEKDCEKEKESEDKNEDVEEKEEEESPKLEKNGLIDDSDDE